MVIVHWFMHCIDFPLAAPAGVIKTTQSAVTDFPALTTPTVSGLTVGSQVSGARGQVRSGNYGGQVGTTGISGNWPR